MVARAAWLWTDRADHLYKLTPADRRLLGPAALELGCLLSWVMGHEERWCQVTIPYVVGKLEMPTRTAKRALRRLRDVGALDYKRHLYKRPEGQPEADDDVQEAVVVEPPRAEFGTKILVKLRGSFWRRGDDHEVFLPWGTWERWKAKNGPHGGTRKGAGRPAAREIKLAPEAGAKCLNPDVGGKSSWPLKYIDTTYGRSGLGTSYQEPGGLRPADFGKGKNQMPNPPTSGPEREAALMAMMRSAEEARVALAGSPQAGPVTLPQIDPPETIAKSHVTMSPAASNEARVTFMVKAYRAAHMAVFGVESKAFAFGDVTRSKMYPGLVLAADVMTREEVAPRSWAEWFLRRDKKKGKKASPASLVFNAKLIARWHGWFRKEWDGGGLRLNITRLHHEQLFRRREAQKLARGASAKGALLGLPTWYVELRRKEQAAGIADPIDAFPGLPKHRRGR